MFDQALLSLYAHFNNPNVIFSFLGVLSLFLMEIFFIYNAVLNKKRKEWTFSIQRKEIDSSSDLLFVMICKLGYLFLAAFFVLLGSAIITVLLLIIYVINSEVLSVIAGIIIFIAINYLIYKACEPKPKNKKRKSKR